MDTKTLESIIGERLAALVREKYPITADTIIIQLTLEIPGNRYQKHYDLPWRYMREGGYMHHVPQMINIQDGIPPAAVTPDYVKVGKFEEWEKSAKDRQWFLAYVPERDMLFIAW